MRSRPQRSLSVSLSLGLGKRAGDRGSASRRCPSWRREEEGSEQRSVEGRTENGMGVQCVERGRSHWRGSRGRATTSAVVGGAGWVLPAASGLPRSARGVDRVGAGRSDRRRCRRWKRGRVSWVCRGHGVNGAGSDRWIVREATVGVARPPSTALRFACIGDVHNLWSADDERLLREVVRPDVVLFVGDYGNENVGLVRSVAASAARLTALGDANMPSAHRVRTVAAILGNHDAWYTATARGRRASPYNHDMEDRVREQLQALRHIDVGYGARRVPLTSMLEAASLSIVGGVLSCARHAAVSRTHCAGGRMCHATGGDEDGRRDGRQSGRLVRVPAVRHAQPGVSGAQRSVRAGRPGVQHMRARLCHPVRFRRTERRLWLPRLATGYRTAEAAVVARRTACRRHRARARAAVRVRPHARGALPWREQHPAQHGDRAGRHGVREHRRRAAHPRRQQHHRHATGARPAAAGHPAHRADARRLAPVYGHRHLLAGFACRRRGWRATPGHLPSRSTARATGDAVLAVGPPTRHHQPHPRALPGASADAATCRLRSGGIVGRVRLLDINRPQRLHCLFRGVYRHPRVRVRRGALAGDHRAARRSSDAADSPRWGAQWHAHRAQPPGVSVAAVACASPQYVVQLAAGAAAVSSGRRRRAGAPGGGADRAESTAP
eukprot:ctg_3935.g571